MKKPDEIKQDIIDCMDEAIVVNETGDAHDLLDFSDKAHVCMATALTYIQQLEASYSQVSKALCGKEKASLTEILEAITQVKAERDDARMNHAHVASLLDKTVEMKERFKNLFVKAVKEKQAALDALPRWRSMKEEPPERPTGVIAKLMGEEYLVCIQGAGSSTTLHYFPDGSWRDEDDNRYPVEWWMPKPEVKRWNKND